MSAFDAIYGYASVKRELEQIADFLKHPECYESVGSVMPAGLLIDGEPGLGKTLMATCLMEESGLESFVCRKTQAGKGMVELIRKAFEEAAAFSPSIILLDDLDKFSNSDYRLRDTEEYVTVQSCMDEYKNQPIFVVATTNCHGKLPKSLTREGRFDRIIRLEPPCGEDALAIVSHYLEGKTCALDVRPQDVADIISGRSCAFLETVINEASLLAGFERAEAVSLEHFIRAYARIELHGELSVPDGIHDPVRLADAWSSSRSQAAYHEAGHIVMMELLRNRVSSVAFLVSSKDTVSGLSKSRLDTVGSSFDDVRDDIAISLAGGLAVEMKYGVPCTGCAGDNEKAANAARSMVARSSYVGSYYAIGTENRSTEAYDAALERACAALLEQIRWDVRGKLARNWAAVELVAGVLYAKGYILSDEIDSIAKSVSFAA